MPISAHSQYWMPSDSLWNLSTYDTSRGVSGDRADGAGGPDPASHLTTNREKSFSIKTYQLGPVDTTYASVCSAIHVPNDDYKGALGPLSIYVGRTISVYFAKYDRRRLRLAFRRTSLLERWFCPLDGQQSPIPWKIFKYRNEYLKSTFRKTFNY